MSLFAERESIRLRYREQILQLLQTTTYTNKHIASTLGVNLGLVTAVAKLHGIPRKAGRPRKPVIS